MIVISQIREFFIYWYLVNSGAYWNFVKGFYNGMERELGVVANIYNWYNPLFQDNDYIGRIIGPIFRTMRIFVGLIIYVFAGIGFLSCYLIVFYLPVLVIYMMIQNLSWLFTKYIL